MTTTPMYGWFDSDDQEEPTFDPWPDAPCPHCGQPISSTDVITHSFAGDFDPERSFFYRTHGSCHEHASQAERDAYLQHLIGKVVG